MDYLSEHKQILKAAVSNKIPSRIIDSSEVSLDALRDLIEGGYIKAANFSDSDGTEYRDPRITVPGREYLNHLEEKAYERSLKGRAHRISIRILDWIGGIVAGVIITLVNLKL